MSSTAADDQWSEDRDAALDEMVQVVQPHEWRQGGAMRYAGHTITWGEYVQRRKELIDEPRMQAQDDLADAWDAGEERMDAIGTNGAEAAWDGSEMGNPWLSKHGHRLKESTSPTYNSDGESALSQALSMPSKYHVRLKGAWCDVYDVLKAFGVTNPADQHAIKKMLMPGKRGHKGGIQDRREAIQSLHRAIELEDGQ